jgi:hypothetical protein
MIVSESTEGEFIMSLFDTIMGAAGGHPTVANMAEKLGIDAGTAEKAIAALGKSHTEDGDTVELAAAKTGLDTGMLGSIVDQLGGESSLTKFNQILNENPKAKGILDMLDRDGDGNPLNDIAGMASSLFGKK